MNEEIAVSTRDVFTTPDGKEHTTLEEAQRHFRRQAIERIFLPYKEHTRPLSSDLETVEAVLEKWDELAQLFTPDESGED